MAGRVGLVTGAGQGLGRAVAERLAAAGAVVVVNDIDEGRAGATVEAITAAGGIALAAPGDVAVEDDVERCVSVAEAEHGPLDFACNNAVPAVRLQPVDQLDLSYMQRLVAVALVGTALCLKHEVRAMRRGGGGSIVSISSTAQLRGQAGATVYAGCKAGIEAMTRVAANEVGPDGIRVNAVRAGGMLTPALLEAMGGSPTIKQHMEAAVPLRRVAEPDEVADVVLFLTSDLSRYVTGSVVTADGGGLLHPSRLPTTAEPG
jgi:NAD(P)-dependent dehydrogenase (short-subunit alcohol dehydrogenase family)